MSAAGVWKEAQAPDGRTYYYNTATNATTWERPADLATPTGPTPASAWKVHTAPDGRNYYEDTIKKTTTWEMPEVLKNAGNHANNARVQAAQSDSPSAFVRSNSRYRFASIHDSNYYDYDHDDANVAEFRPFTSSPATKNERDGDRDRDGGFARPERSMTERMPFGRGAEQKEEQYASLQEAEAVFFKLLKRVGVESDWSWEQMVKETVRDPGYRAIQDAKDRKTAFDKYIAQVRTEEKEKEKDRQAKLEDEFMAMLKSHPEIKFYTRWTTARPMIEDEMVFKAAKHEDERVQLFNDFRAKQFKEYKEKESEATEKAIAKLLDLLPTVNITPFTRWSEAQDLITSSDVFENDKGLQNLPKAEIINAFEKHKKNVEEMLNHQRQGERVLKARQERQNRDGFIALLSELRDAGKIKANSKWSELLPLFEDDPRYEAMLGQGGSTPIELFWDMVEEEDRALRDKRNIVYDVLEQERYEVTTATSFDDFGAVMQADPRTAAYSVDTLRQIYDRVLAKVAERAEKERYKAEREHRHKIEDLRSKIKRLSHPSVQIGDAWEDVRGRLEKYAEYQDLDDDGRKEAFNKHIRRLKEKDEDDRKRDHRNGSTSKRHRTATPEQDAYEADRRKAQAARESTYNKRRIPGVSPPPRERVRDWDSAGDRYEPRADRGERRRDDSRDRDGRESRKVSSSNHYDRDRRDREAERERSYLSRADPKERTTVLEYGDEEGEVRPSASGSRSRRRDSDAESMRSSKRLKRYERDTASPRETRDARREKTPAKTVEPEAGFHSGSEEGEIEED